MYGDVSFCDEMSKQVVVGRKGKEDAAHQKDQTGRFKTGCGHT